MIDSRIGESTSERWGPHADSLVGRTVVTMLAANRLPHAVLLTGPSGVGKRDLALRIAQAMLCDSPDRLEVGPCRVCRNCLRLHDPTQPQREPQHADVELVGPGSLCAVSEHNHANTRTIGICIIRRIEHVTTLTPFEADRRVIIIDPAERMTPEAADAFLKTLEEPPEGVYFLLASAAPQQLSETIRSRCRTLSLAPLATEQLEAWLGQLPASQRRQLSQDPAERDELLRLARGRPSWLLDHLRDGDPVRVRAAQIDDAMRLAQADRAERFNWSEQLLGRSATPQSLANVELILDAWVDWWRDLWLAQHGQRDALIHLSQVDRIDELSALYDRAEVGRWLRDLERTRGLIQRGVNARLALDVLLLRCPQSANPTNQANKDAQ